MLVSKNGLDPISEILHVVDDEIEHHFHNFERWFGSGAVEDALTPYTLTSGNADFGSEVLIFDTGDTPTVAGKRFFDMRRIQVISLSHSSVYIIRFIWGTGTVGDAETAGQYTTIPFIATGVGSNLVLAAADILTERLAVGTKVWGKTKNATNAATIDILVGKHEYFD